MDYEATTIIQKELGPDEDLLWAGRPKQGIVFRSEDVFFIPFSLLWGGFAIFWEIMAIKALLAGMKKGELEVIILPIFGIPFVIMGLYLIFGRFFVDAMRRKNTFYGLTNKRVIIVSGLFNKKIESLNIGGIKDISFTEKRNGYGTITFGRKNVLSPFYAGSTWPGAKNDIPMFELIPNAKDVYYQIRNLQGKAG